MIYGCDLAASEDGRTLTEALGALCDCDVAASIDDTGHAQLGGDWELDDPPTAVNDAYSVDEDATLTVDWWDTDWTRRQELTFDNSGQTETLSDFAVLVYLRREIIFVDTKVDDYQALLSDINPHAEVVLLDASRDGVQQIAEALAGREDFDAIHIVSHGDQAELQLGITRLTLDSMLAGHADDLVIIGQALSEDADILVYGCNFGEGALGQAAAARLAELTGADVAASTDDTGHAIFGADWDLEYSTGSIETSIAFSLDMQQNWGHLLNVAVDATTTGTSGGGDFSISHTTSGTDRLMLVGVSINEASNENVTSITYNGDSLTPVGIREDGDAVVEIWSLVAPDVGTYNVNVTLSGTTDGNTAGVTTFTGVDQTTPLGAFASGSGVGGSGSATVNSAGGELVFATIAVDDATDYDLVPGGTQTERWDLIGGPDINGGGMTESGAASVVMDWTWSGSDNWAVGGVSIKPLSSPAITARETVDADGNGQIDQIKITTDQNLDDDFASLTITVSGYTVTGYSTDTANDAIFYVDLTESGSPDTDATPDVTVTANTTLSEFGGSNNIATDATNWWDTDWLNRREITFDNQASAQDLDDFPLLVKLTSSEIDYAKVQDAGEDLRFYDEDTSQLLKYEIEEWNEGARHTSG